MVTHGQRWAVAAQRRITVSAGAGEKAAWRRSCWSWVWNNEQKNLKAEGRKMQGALLAFRAPSAPHPQSNEALWLVEDLCLLFLRCPLLVSQFLLPHPVAHLLQIQCSTAEGPKISPKRLYLSLDPFPCSLPSSPSDI